MASWRRLDHAAVLCWGLACAAAFFPLYGSGEPSSLNFLVARGPRTASAASASSSSLGLPSCTSSSSSPSAGVGWSLVLAWSSLTSLALLRRSQPLRRQGLAGRGSRLSGLQHLLGSTRRVRDRTVRSQGGADVAVAEAPPVWEKGAVPPIWVVNLDRSADRWRQSCEEFAKQSIEPVRWSATDGKALSEEELQDKATWWARHFCTPGMVGCFSSHLGIWKKIVDQKIPCVVVVEDDVIPYEGFVDKIADLQSELQALKGGWDVCLLGAIGCINPDKEPFGMRFYELGVGGGRPVPKGSSTRTLSEHLFVPHRPAGTHAYMISYEGARRLMERMPKARYHVDLAAWGVKDLKLTASNPFLATQRFDEGAESTVAKSGSKTERFLSFVLQASGILAMAKKGGVPNFSWAWRTAVFAFPVPWRKWPKHTVEVSQGPFTSLLVMLLMAGLVRRSAVWTGIGFAYLCVMSTFIRFLCGTINWRVFLAEAGLSAAFLTYGLAGVGPVRL